jgi:hypothetical protein
VTNEGSQGPAEERSTPSTPNTAPYDRAEGEANLRMMQRQVEGRLRRQPRFVLPPGHALRIDDSEVS